MLSIIVSFRNEAEVLPLLLGRLEKSISPLEMDYEIIFVNDASTDQSLTILKKAADQNRHVKIVNMSRNFGNGPCVLAGLKYSQGDAVITIDADLQDPPEIIGKMVELWKEGADVVYTTRLTRAGESRVKMWITKAAYRILRFASEINLPVDSGDFKLLSRRVVNHLIQLNEKDPFLRGLVPWVGFKQVPLYYHREKRADGKSHYPLVGRGPARAFFSGLTSFSKLPLTASFVFGLAVAVLSFFYFVAVLVMFFMGMNLPGWTAIMAVTLVLGGTQLLTLGFVGMFVGRIYDEVKGRPNFIVESSLGFVQSTAIDSRPTSSPQLNHGGEAEVRTWS